MVGHLEVSELNRRDELEIELEISPQLPRFALAFRKSRQNAPSKPFKAAGISSIHGSAPGPLNSRRLILTTGRRSTMLR